MILRVPLSSSLPLLLVVAVLIGTTSTVTTTAAFVVPSTTTPFLKHARRSSPSLVIRPVFGDLFKNFGRLETPKKKEEEKDKKEPPDAAVAVAEEEQEEEHAVVSPTAADTAVVAEQIEEEATEATEATEAAAAASEHKEEKSSAVVEELVAKAAEEIANDDDEGQEETVEEVAALVDVAAEIDAAEAVEEEEQEERDAAAEETEATASAEVAAEEERPEVQEEEEDKEERGTVDGGGAEAAVQVASEEKPFATVDTAGGAEQEEETQEEAAATPAEPAPQPVRHTLFCGNIDFDVKREEIEELFAQHGTVVLCNAPKNRYLPDQTRGFAFVDMATREEMERAMDAIDGLSFRGRTLRVTESVSKEELEEKRAQQKERRKEQQKKRNKRMMEKEGFEKLYVGGLPFEITREQLTDFFADYTSRVGEVYLPSDREDPSRGRGFAFVYVRQEDAQQVIERADGQDVGGRAIAVSKPLPPGEKASHRRHLNEDRIKLYVGNLSFYTLPETLYEIFEEFGDIHDCYMPVNRDTGSGSRGFAFVTMDKEAGLQAITELDGCEVDNRYIRVNQAQPKGSRQRDSTPEEDFDNDTDDNSGWTEDDDY